MKILIRQFLGKLHSWSFCGHGIASSLKEAGHEVHLFSTDGIQHLPDFLKENLIGYTEENIPKLFGKKPDTDYDCQISYTCMKNFPYLLSSGNKNRFGIWCYEWAGKNVLPSGFAKCYKFCDFLCAPSNFAKQIFIDSGVPENHIKVIPHGIYTDAYKQETTIKLSTNKKVKILTNIASNHIRKNIPGLLEAYGKAFSKKDDVCLILKSKFKKVESQFEVSLEDCLSNFKKKFPNHAEIKVFSDYLSDISILYRSVDILYTLPFCEGFLMPALESIACGKMVIAPNWGGQLDFLNSSNALLVDGEEKRANPKSMYWDHKDNAIWFVPSIDDTVSKLRYAVENYQKINASIDREAIYEKYSWTNVSNQFIKLCV